MLVEVKHGEMFVLGLKMAADCAAVRPKMASVCAAVRSSSR